MPNNNQNGRSIAIWGEAPQGTVAPDGSKLNVHFNYWHVKSQKAKINGVRDFLDIGLMAYGCSHLSRLRIYVPLSISIADIEDLGSLFKESVVASIVFNENVATTNVHNSNYVTLHVVANDVYARVYMFTAGTDGVPASNELSVTSVGDGTFIDICQPAIGIGYAELEPEKPLYFRLRIRLPAKGNTSFSRTMKPSDGWLLSSFDYTEFLDFRLNEARNLPQNATQLMWPGGKKRPETPPIASVDYLVIVGESADVAEGVECDKKRLLESELWGTYTNTPKGWQQDLSNGMVIYHWKKLAKSLPAGIDDFSAFIKLKIRRSGWSLVWRYLAVVALIGSLGSLLASFAWTKFDMEKWVKSADAKATESHELPLTGCPPPVDNVGRKDNGNSKNSSAGRQKLSDTGKNVGIRVAQEMPR